MNIHKDKGIVFQKGNTFTDNKPNALTALGITSVDKCTVTRLVTFDAAGKKQDFLFSDKTKKWSCLFGDLVERFECSTLTEIKDLASAFFTPEIYNAGHGGFASALFHCSKLEIHFEHGIMKFTAKDGLVADVQF